jgi:hypothetical protein
MVPILPKLPEFPGVRDGYRLASDLRSKAFTCHSRVQAARRRCESVRLAAGGGSLERTRLSKPENSLLAGNLQGISSDSGLREHDFNGKDMQR